MRIFHGNREDSCVAGAKARPLLGVFGTTEVVPCYETRGWLLWYPMSPKEGDMGHPSFVEVLEKTKTKTTADPYCVQDDTARFCGVPGTRQFFCGSQIPRFLQVSGGWGGCVFPGNKMARIRNESGLFCS